jgi:hypothetical protein
LRTLGPEAQPHRPLASRGNAQLPGLVPQPRNPPAHLDAVRVRHVAGVANHHPERRLVPKNDAAAGRAARIEGDPLAHHHLGARLDHRRPRAHEAQDDGVAAGGKPALEVKVDELPARLGPGLRKQAETGGRPYLEGVGGGLDDDRKAHEAPVLRLDGGGGLQPRRQGQAGQPHQERERPHFITASGGTPAPPGTAREVRRPRA